MKTLEQWFDLARSSVRTTDAKAREIAVMCWHDEQSGGTAATWHMSSVVHGNVQCACQACRFTVQA